jgi:hypothetical protein
MLTSFQAIVNFGFDPLSFDLVLRKTQSVVAEIFQFFKFWGCLPLVRNQPKAPKGKKSQILIFNWLYSTEAS